MRWWPAKPLRATGMLFVACCVSSCVQQAPAAVERGHVISALPTNQMGENTNTGAVAGVVLGTAVGAVIGGRGAGRIIGAFAGEVVGGTAGAAVETATQTPTGIAYTIKLLDGRIVTVVEHHPIGDPIYPQGSQIAIETRGRTQHVVSAAWVE
jgi:outer membrane lipoprotein SlyB